MNETVPAMHPCAEEIIYLQLEFIILNCNIRYADLALKEVSQNIPTCCTYVEYNCHEVVKKLHSYLKYFLR